MFDKLSQRFADYLPNVISAAIIFAAGYVAIRLILKLMRTAFSHSKVDATAWKFLLSVTKAVLYVIVIVMVLSQLKIPMSSIITALGTAGLAIVLALKDSLSNVAGGFIVMFTRPFKVDDYIEINGDEGFVRNITLLNTKLLTIDNKAVIIPNSTVASATVVNYTQEELRRLELRFAVSYESDFRKAKLLVSSVCRENPLALDKPAEPYIRMSGHGDSSVELLLRVWVRTEDYWELRFGLLEEVKAVFEANGISIPYPQLDVHENKLTRTALH